MTWQINKRIVTMHWTYRLAIAASIASAGRWATYKKPTAQIGTFGFCLHAKPTLKNQKSLFFLPTHEQTNEDNKLKFGG